MQKKCDRVEKVIQVLTQSPEVEKSGIGLWCNAHGEYLNGPLAVSKLWLEGIL